MKQRFFNFKGLLALALGVVTIASTGCDPKEPEVPTLPSLSVKANGAEVVNNQTINIGKAGGEIALTVTTNRAWTATAADSFVTVSPASGDADEKGVSVKVTVAANSDEARTATVTVATTTDNKTVAFKIAQEGEVVPVGDITIKEIRDMGETTINVDKTLIATVISDASASGGNATSKKNIVIQDATAGIAIRLTADPEDGQFAPGNLVSIKVKDLAIAKYDDLLQLNNVPNALLEKVGTNVIERKEITAAQLLSGDYESQLVAVKDVQFTSDVIGKPIGTDAAHATLNMESSDGKTFIAFMSRFSTFIGTTVPEGSGTIKGIGSINKAVMQVLPQTAADFDGMTGARFAEAPKFGVAKTAVSVPAAGGEATVGVTGNVAWTVAVKAGAEYLSAGPTPTSGNSEGTISVTFKENKSTEATPTVTITVSTTANVATKSYDIVFTQAAALGGGEKQATFDIPAMGLTNQEVWGIRTVNGITITGALGANPSNDPKYYTSGSALRTYAGNTLTFTGGTIIKIELTNRKGSARVDGYTASVGTLAGDIKVDGGTATWTGSAAEVVFTTNPQNTDGVANPQHHFSKFVVTYQ
jgi:hypothetical protein